MFNDKSGLIMLAILPDDEKAAREMAERAGISIADLTLLALRYCLRAKGGEPFRELLAKGAIAPPSADDK